MDDADGVVFGAVKRRIRILRGFQKSRKPTMCATMFFRLPGAEKAMFQDHSIREMHKKEDETGN